jgi:SAM-dependent methyltransferase
VLDIGCGAGVDLLLAAMRVGPEGRAIGVDMTPAMVERARGAAAAAGLSQVEVRQGDATALPVADGSVDVVTSNGVLNLVPEKERGFAEIVRVLKPGGRLAVSDIALKKPLPNEVAEDVMAYVGCIAGAIPIADYEAGLRESGFAHVQVIDSGADLNAYAKVENSSGCCSPPVSLPIANQPAKTSCCGSKPADTGSPDLHKRMAELLSRCNVNDYAASVKVYAVRPTE